VLGTTLQSLSAFLALAVAFVMAPAIAYVTKSRFYIARAPRQNWSGHALIRCAICEHPFETEDMAHCPAYSGPICSLCCSLETRCRDCCKPQARISTQVLGVRLTRTTTPSNGAQVLGTTTTRAGGLPFTGSNVLVLLGAGVLLVAVGGGTLSAAEAARR